MGPKAYEWAAGTPAHPTARPAASCTQPGLGHRFDAGLEMATAVQRARDQAALLGVLERPLRDIGVGALGYPKARAQGVIGEARLALLAGQHALDRAIEREPGHAARARDAPEGQHETGRERPHQQRL